MKKGIVKQLNLTRSNLIDGSVILMMVSMFVVGYLCSSSYKGTAENFVLLDFWNMGMYGALKYILYDIVILIFILAYKRSLLLPFAFFAIFSVKDFVQFFIDGNIESLPDTYVIFFIGLIFIAIFHLTKQRRVMKKDDPAGTEHPHPPQEGE